MKLSLFLSPTQEMKLGNNSLARQQYEGRGKFLSYFLSLVASGNLGPGVQ